MEDEGFLLEIQRLSFEMDKVIEKYGVRDRVMQLMVIGLMDEDIMGNTRLKAIYSYQIESDDELASMITFVGSTWDNNENKYNENDEPDLGDLLDGLGIDLED
jgi:hypothetical protein|tara:strand:- start:39423 stop:39731 length:309 start_codon:yes stop_codon:yes gene_type:complete